MTIASLFVTHANAKPSTWDWEDTIGDWDANHPHHNLAATSVLAEIVDTTRWAVVHRQVFRFPDNSHAEVTYSSPATEYQEQDPECEWFEVEAVPVTVVTYQRKATK